MKTLGLIVNPIAGMGGKVGLKGTDGAETIDRAIEMGALPEAGDKATLALQQLEKIRGRLTVLTCPGTMGEVSARLSGFNPRLVPGITEPTSDVDTVAAARFMADQKVDLLLFAGGDGTARNLCQALGPDSSQAVIGIPAGVKIHSAVYATSPRNAGLLARYYLEDAGLPLRKAEVMDIDEEAFREGYLSARLYGYLSVPTANDLMQNLKIGGLSSEQSVVESIATYVVEKMEQDVLYIIGPGTTTGAIMAKLDLDNTLLGVDLVLNGRLYGADVNENEIMAALVGRQGWIIVTVIGGQGFIFGRGNQQISAGVLAAVGREKIVVVATREKILGLGGKSLRVDCGDEQVNSLLSGYYRILTGYGEELIYKVTT